MRKSRFTDDQKKAILDLTKSGLTVRKICCQNDISNATFYHWRRLQEIVDFDPMAPTPVIQRSAPVGAPRKAKVQHRVWGGQRTVRNEMKRNWSDTAEVDSALMLNEPINSAPS